MYYCMAQVLLFRFEKEKIKKLQEIIWGFRHEKNFAQIIRFNGISIFICFQGYKKTI